MVRIIVTPSLVGDYKRKQSSIFLPLWTKPSGENKGSAYSHRVCPQPLPFRYPAARSGVALSYPFGQNLVEKIKGLHIATEFALSLSHSATLLKGLRAYQTEGFRDLPQTVRNFGRRAEQREVQASAYGGRGLHSGFAPQLSTGPAGGVGGSDSGEEAGAGRSEGPSCFTRARASSAARRVGSRGVPQWLHPKASPVAPALERYIKNPVVSAHPGRPHIADRRCSRPRTAVHSGAKVPSNFFLHKQE